MNSASWAAAVQGGTQASWGDRYERLRRVGHELGAQVPDDAQGLTLFLRQGTVSWMASLATRTETPPARPAPPPAHGALVLRDRVVVTQLLATMVGAAAKVQG